MFTPYRFSFAALLLGVYFLVGTSAHAVVVVFDNFDSAGATIGDDANDPTDIAWSGFGGSNLAVNGAKDFSPPGALRNQGGGTFRFQTGALPSEQTLTRNGDQLILSMRFRTNNQGGLNSRDIAEGYRFGLFASDNTGYFINIAGGDDASDFSLLRDEGDGGLGNNGGTGNTTLATFGAGATTIDDEDAAHDIFRLTLLRTDSGVDLLGEYLDNGVGTPVTLAVSDNTAPITSFDRIFHGLGNHPIDDFIDDVSLEFIAVPLPEPSALALLGLGAASLLRRRRAA